MKKILRYIFLNNFKNILFMLINSRSEYFEFKKIEIKIKKNCKLGKKNTNLSTKIDQVITPNLLKKGEWEYFTIRFILKFIKNKKIKYDFIDIGANIGLTTKQLIVSKSKIQNFHCIEPEIENFNILTKNLSLYKNVSFHNFALTDKKDKTKRIYLNKDNFGDYSLLKKSNQKSSIIKTLNANIFFRKIISEYKIKNIIYKSDTQGFDEIILLSLKEEFLNKINILIIEITNFKYLKNYSLDLINIIKKFDYVEDKNGDKISENEIINKINKEIEFDIFCARN